tara:strand:+ start:448 stop:600 length:153 start_codon:yes stop_codon:yes gene_type:complete
MSTATLIIIILIVLHLLIGFGWLIYKLSPRKEDQKDSSPEDDSTKNPEEA